MNHHWCRRRRCECTPKTFDLVKIRAKSLKIRAKYVDIWAKCVNTFAKSLFCFVFTKMPPKIKVQTFFWRSFSLEYFWQVWGNLGKNSSHPLTICLLLHLFREPHALALLGQEIKGNSADDLKTRPATHSDEFTKNLFFIALIFINCFMFFY